MKYVTRIQPHSKVYSFAGPKLRFNLQVDLFEGGVSSSTIMDQRELARLYLNSREPQPEKGSNYKFTGPAHCAMSEFVFKNRPLIIRIQRQPFQCDRKQGQSAYLLEGYYNGRFHDSLMDRFELDHWFWVNKGKAIFVQASLSKN